jgi:hypothetical protein
MCLAVALAFGLGGCATVLESNQQELTVQTIEDNKEIFNVGCVLSNSAGRWFVTAPGKVWVTRSTGDLKIDCKKTEQKTELKTEQSVGSDILVSKLNNIGLWGNAVLTAGIGYYIDKRTGSGFDYPSTVTVIMTRTAPPVVAAPPGGSVVY